MRLDLKLQGGTPYGGALLATSLATSNNSHQRSRVDSVLQLDRRDREEIQVWVCCLLLYFGCTLRDSWLRDQLGLLY